MVSRRKASAETPTEELATPTSVAGNGHAQQELAPASSNGVAHFEILNPAPTNGAHEASDPGESGAPPRRRTRSRSAKPDETAVEPSEAQVVQAILGPAATAKVDAPASPVAHGARSAGAPEAAPAQDRPQQRQPDGDRTERPKAETRTVASGQTGVANAAGAATASNATATIVAVTATTTTTGSSSSSARTGPTARRAKNALRATSPNGTGHRARIGSRCRRSTSLRCRRWQWRS